MSVGTLCQAHSQVITDTFGIRTRIGPNNTAGTPDSGWLMFQLAHTHSSGLAKPAANLFFLPPALLTRVEGRPFEEVLFMRDEMANLAWCVKRLVENAVERTLNRFEVYLELDRRCQGNSRWSRPVGPAPGRRIWIITSWLI